MTYEEVVEHIAQVPKFSPDDTFSNTRELIRRIGNPQEQMKIIHIAGTNGKGSVSAFTSSILVKAGKRTGLFTSPHLIRMNERFQIQNEPVSDDLFIKAYEEVIGVCQEMLLDGWYHPTFFDILFAMAMVIFREEKVEYAVLETGMGGRRDATNICEHSLGCVITTIGLDHTEILGDTIGKIAYEKAGIIKKKVPVVYDAREEEAASVIKNEADNLEAFASPFIMEMTEIIKTTESSIDFLLHVPYYEGCIIHVPYVAPYQVVNASLALLLMENIDPDHAIPIKNRLEGIASTRWQGRMETVLPGVIVDGAHNANGIEEFVRTLRQVRDNRRIVLLFSAVVEKNYDEMIHTICNTGCFDEVVVTEIKGSRMVEASVLADVFRKYTDVPVTEVSEVEDAFVTAYEKKAEGLLFCVGSLYLVAEVKKVIMKEKYHD